MTAAAFATPVRAEPRDAAPAAAGPDGHTRSTAVIPISAAEPVFAGHYPDFPIFPGVCVVECAHLAALATAPPAAGPLRLETLESARFLGAVFPGDELTVEMTWKAREHGWSCSAVLRTERAVAAKVRLRYLTPTEVS